MTPPPRAQYAKGSCSLDDCGAVDIAVKNTCSQSLDHSHIKADGSEVKYVEISAAVGSNPFDDSIKLGFRYQDYKTASQGAGEGGATYT